MSTSRSHRAVALFAAVVTAAAVAQVIVPAAGATGPARAEVQPSVRVRDAYAPTLTAAGPHGMLLTVQRPVPQRAATTLYAASGWHAASAVPTWGRLVALGRVAAFSQPVVAFNDDGVGVVAWGTGRNGGGTVVRTRTPRGGWSATYRIPHAALGYGGMVGAAVNARGVVAVVAPGDDGHPYARVAVRRPGRAWHVYRAPGAAWSATSVALTADGTVEVAGGYADRGGEGYAQTGTLTPDGHWSTSVVSALGNQVEDQAIYATGDGTQYLVVGRVGSWRSTDDTEAYWPTRYTVLTRSTRAGRWTRVWDRDGAAAIEVQPLRSRLRLTWVQYADPASSDLGPTPQKLELRTVLIPGASGPERVLTVEDAATPYASDLPFTAAQSLTTSAYAAGWRTHASARPVSPLTTWLGGTTRTYPDASAPVLYDTQAQVACVGGRCSVARTVRQRLSGSYLVGGAVEVDPLG